eukprot:scaffold561_cov162-Amphora_coffeaeformis.AAC.15
MAFANTDQTAANSPKADFEHQNGNTNQKESEEVRNEERPFAILDSQSRKPPDVPKTHSTSDL